MAGCASAVPSPSGSLTASPMLPILVLPALVLAPPAQEALTREQLALMLLLLYVVEAFAFFVAWGSYFTMLLPLALLLLVSLGKNR